MNRKLTLELDQTVVNSAIKYAENNQKTLSKLVEDFFKGLIRENNHAVEYPQLIESLSGIVSEKEVEKYAQEDERIRYILRIDR